MILFKSLWWPSDVIAMFELIGSLGGSLGNGNVLWLFNFRICFVTLWQIHHEIHDKLTWIFEHLFLFNIVSILDVFRGDIGLDKWHSKYLHRPKWQQHNYLFPIYVLLEKDWCLESLNMNMNHGKLNSGLPKAIHIWNI